MLLTQVWTPFDLSLLIARESAHHDRDYLMMLNLT